MIKSILTVCIGNICRSPMAEGLLKHRLPGIHVESAGIGALIGHKADPLALSLMVESGIDISGHVARQISQSICQKADIILVMDMDQKKFIENRYPSARGKVFRIAESLSSDVPDPYKRDREYFAHVFALLDAGADAWIGRIKKLTDSERQFS